MYLFVQIANQAIESVRFRVSLVYVAGEKDSVLDWDLHKCVWMLHTVVLCEAPVCCS